MPGNNPNQNRTLPENKSKEPLEGFPGETNMSRTRKKLRSSQEVADARKANVRNTRRR